jgi:hypothetical protein
MSAAAAVTSLRGSTLPDLAGLLTDDKPNDRPECLEFVQAVHATRRKLIFCARRTKLCMAVAALGAPREGHQVHPVADAISVMRVPAASAKAHIAGPAGFLRKPRHARGPR